LVNLFYGSTSQRESRNNSWSYRLRIFVKDLLRKQYGEYFGDLILAITGFACQTQQSLLAAHPDFFITVSEIRAKAKNRWCVFRIDSRIRANNYCQICVKRSR
jgi:hypothetical protein